MIKPTRGYVLIEPDKAEEKTASGLYVPDNAKEKPQKGVVVSISEPRLRFEGGVRLNADGTCTIPDEHSPAEVGDKVYFKRWGGDEIKEDGKEYKIVKFEDILAVIA